MDRVVVVSAVRDFDMYSKCVAENPHVAGCGRFFVDNREKGDGVGVCYNRFIDGYDFAVPAWFVFCHEDWEAKEPLADKVAKLDRDSLWGVIGATTVRRFGVYAQWRLLGEIEECRKDGTGLRKQGCAVPEGTRVDTFDCQCLMVHSSLVKRLGLRFDEHLTFDLYVEDFCIAAHETGAVASRIVPLRCRHWSGGDVQPRYKLQEAYLDGKWRDAGPYTGASSLLLGGNAPWWWRTTVAAKRFARRLISR